MWKRQRVWDVSPACRDLLRMSERDSLDLDASRSGHAHLVHNGTSNFACSCTKLYSAAVGPTSAPKEDRQVASGDVTNATSEISVLAAVLPDALHRCS